MGFNECDTHLSLAGIKTQAAPLMIKVSYKSYLFYLQILTDHYQDYNNDLKFKFFFISIYKNMSTLLQLKKDLYCSLVG